MMLFTVLKKNTHISFLKSGSATKRKVQTRMILLRIEDFQFISLLSTAYLFLSIDHFSKLHNANCSNACTVGDT